MRASRLNIINATASHTGPVLITLDTKLLVQGFDAKVEIENTDVDKALALLAELHFMPGGDESMGTYHTK